MQSFIHINLSEGPNSRIQKILERKNEDYLCQTLGNQTRKYTIILFFLKVRKVEVGERDMLIEVLKKWFSRSQKNL